MAATLITAHNGADATPEDSMEFVRMALASGADVMEIDIRRLADGKLVFAHDLPINPAGLSGQDARILNTGSSSHDLPSDPAAPADPDARDLKTGCSSPHDLPSDPAAPADPDARILKTGCSSPGPVPIEDVFLALRESSKLVNCDLKEPHLESAVAELAERCGISDRLIYSGTVSAPYCMETGLNRCVKILLNIEEYIPGLYARCQKDSSQIHEAAREISAVCLRYGIDCVNANYRLANDRFIEILAQQGIGLSVWTVNTLPEALHFIERGIYNVTTRNLQQVLSAAFPLLHLNA